MRILVMSDLSLSHLELTSEEKFLRATYNLLKPDLEPERLPEEFHLDDELLSSYEKNMKKYEELKNKIRYTCLEDYKHIIRIIQPDLILLAGDVFHEGQSKEDLLELIELFRFIDQKTIQCYLIEGNWEKEHYAEILLEIKNLDFVEDISNREIEYQGLKILGINFDYANRIRICKKLSQLFPNKYDFVLTHAPENKRIWLFNLDTKYVITGHSGVDLGKVEKKVYITNDYTPEFYFVIDYFSSQEQKISCIRNDQLFAKLSFKKKKYTWQRKMKHINYFLGGHAASFHNKIIRLKKKIEKANDDEQIEIIQKIIDKGENFRWVRDYIGNQYFKDRLFFECDICGNKYHQYAGLNWHKKVVHKTDKS